jgi:hypothetical protein
MIPFMLVELLLVRTNLKKGYWYSIRLIRLTIST